MTNYFYKNADADELIFIHEGSGQLKSMYGRLDFGSGIDPPCVAEVLEASDATSSSPWLRCLPVMACQRIVGDSTEVRKSIVLTLTIR